MSELQSFKQRSSVNCQLLWNDGLVWHLFYTKLEITCSLWLLCWDSHTHTLTLTHTHTHRPIHFFVTNSNVLTDCLITKIEFSRFVQSASLSFDPFPLSHFLFGPFSPMAILRVSRCQLSLLLLLYNAELHKREQCSTHDKAGLNEKAKSVQKVNSIVEYSFMIVWWPILPLID